MLLYGFPFALTQREEDDVGSIVDIAGCSQIEFSDRLLSSLRRRVGAFQYCLDEPEVMSEHGFSWL